MAPLKCCLQGQSVAGQYRHPPGGWRYSTDQLPSVPATTVAVVPSG
ncbi:hypothetical protein ACT43Q_06855 [Acinetobacter baumannii]